MLAMRLAAAGREVVLLEKEREAHHKVCGEFLSREAVAYLEQTGLDPRQLGACAITRVRLSSGKRATEARLPFTALSLSRFVLDDALLLRAQEAGSELRRGVVADRMERRSGDWLVQLRSAAAVSAKTVFLATGKHDLRAWERRGGTQTNLVGFKMHWKLAPVQTDALSSVMELFLFRGGYGGLSWIENKTANLCLVIRRNRLHKLGGWQQVVQAICAELPQLRERLENATACWTKPLAISPIPYGYSSGAADGVWRVGDQAAVIPSFTGDGMSIALHSGALAAEMYLAGKNAEEYARSLNLQLRSAMRFASLLSHTMVTAAGRIAAPRLLSFLPGTMGHIASLTRIPDRALVPAPIPNGITPAQQPIATA